MVHKQFSMKGGENLDENRVALGALLLAIGLVVSMFGAAYTAWWLAWEGLVSRLGGVMIVLGFISILAGIYTCIEGAVRS